MLPVDGKGFLSGFVSAFDAMTRPAPPPAGQERGERPPVGRSAAALPDSQRLEAARALGESGQPTRKGSFLDVKA